MGTRNLIEIDFLVFIAPLGFKGLKKLYELLLSVFNIKMISILLFGQRSSGILVVSNP